MGTRNLTIVKSDGDYKVAQYGQWDGYPSYSGVNILNFLRNSNLQQFKKYLSNVKLLTSAQIDLLWEEIGVDVEKEHFVSIEISNKFYSLHPTLSRDLGCTILESIMEHDGAVELYNDLEFAKNSLFCEYAYVVDLDENKFEIYFGYNKEPLTEKDRFYFDGYCNDGYYPVKLKKSYDIDNLPDKDTFLHDLDDD